MIHAVLTVTWILIGVVVWLTVFAFALALASACKSPWPPRSENVASNCVRVPRDEETA